MKIAFIGTKHIPAKSKGSEKYAEEIACRLIQAGHDVFAYVSSAKASKRPKMYKGMRLVYVPEIGQTFFASIHALFYGYDAIHYHGFVAAKLSIIPKIFKWQTAIVATFYQQDYCHQQPGFLGKFLCQMGEYLACTVPDKIIVNNAILAGWVKEKYQKETSFIRDGIDLLAAKKSDRLSKWKLKEKRYVIFSGKLAKAEGVHYLIEAFKQLENTAKTPNNFKLVIAGRGSGADEYVRYLHTIAAGRVNIVFVPDQTGNNLYQLLSHAYLFVSASGSEEAQPSIIKAMGNGLVCFAANNEANREAIGESGYLFSPGSIVDLRDKLAYVLNRPEEIKKVAELSKKRIQERYSWSWAAEKTLDIYRQALFEKKHQQHKIITHEAK